MRVDYTLKYVLLLVVIPSCGRKTCGKRLSCHMSSELLLSEAIYDLPENY